MSERVLNAANTAIFHMQLNTDNAVQFVSKQAKVDAATAAQAVKETLTGYRSKR